MKTKPPVPVRVLVVEASPTYAAILKEIVDAVPGHEVVSVVPTADEALLVNERDRPDIIITDIQPAGSLSGFALVWRITENYDCDVIGLLRVDHEAYREGAAKHGTCACLLKECVAEELPPLLRSLSDRRVPRKLT